MCGFRFPFYKLKTSMRTLCILAILILAVFAQTPTEPAPADQQNYLTSLPLVKKGYQVPEHLRAKSLLNSEKWASLQVSAPRKPQHGEAAASSATPVPRTVEHKLVHIEVPKAPQKLGGAQTIEKTNDHSTSQKVAEAPEVHNHDQETEEEHAKHKDHDHEAEKKGQNLRNEKAEKKSEKVKSDEKESEKSEVAPAKQAVQVGEPVAAPVVAVQDLGILALSAEKTLHTTADPLPVANAPSTIPQVTASVPQELIQVEQFPGLSQIRAEPATQP